MKKGFTLAEIMIALTIIGVITAILLPVAQNSLPNEKVMKFKKANATLHKVINELVTSGEYYTPGDLGMKPDGELLSVKKEENIKYLCNSIANLITIKSVNCSTFGDYVSLSTNAYYDVRKEYNNLYETLDNICKNTINAGEEIKTSDGVVYYQTIPFTTFGYVPIENETLTSQKDYTMANWHKERIFQPFPCKYQCDDDIAGVSSLYKVFCMDIDGIGKGEDPFGYGIRVDGKIILGTRAQEWLEKSIQDKE